jgi:hypothetical protein
VTEDKKAGILPWKQPRCPTTDEWIKTHIYNGDYSVIRKNEITWFEGKWMQLEDVRTSF